MHSENTEETSSKVNKTAPKETLHNKALYNKTVIHKIITYGREPKETTTPPQKNSRIVFPSTDTRCPIKMWDKEVGKEISLPVEIFTQDQLTKIQSPLLVAVNSASPYKFVSERYP
ncbi:hypothetical protein [Enterococcus viikkiensis]|uniref:hypothetical protein n=1 Tax=Enterococcus viikkiensis TaxID=930854 RepID=UPI003F8E0E08